MNRPRALVTATVGLSLAVVIGVNQLTAAQNAGTNAASGVVQSSALYCTGLTSGDGAAPGYVMFVNTTNQPRTMAVTVAATHSSSPPRVIDQLLAPHTATPFFPSHWVKGDTYALAAYISGGGVAGEQVLTSDHTEGSCVTGGGASWLATGLSTKVGASSTLTIFNPTATEAVLNISALGTSGITQPAPWQGITIGPMGLTTIDLRNEVVNTPNFGLEVNVLRGALVMNDVQVIGGFASLVAGAPAAVQSATMNEVPTSEGASATLHFTNPGSQPATVTLTIDLPGANTAGRVAPQGVTVPALGTASFVVTPNSAIPADGEATVRMSATSPVVMGLSSGSTKAAGRQITTMPTPSGAWTLLDATGRGFGSAAVTNTGTSAATLTVTATQHGVTTTWHTSVAPLSTVPLLTLTPGLTTLRHALVHVTSTSHALILGASAVTKTVGAYLDSGLNGR